MAKSSSISSEDINDLKEILEIEKLSKILEQLYSATGLANFIVDLNGNILHGVGWKSICTEFHRKHKISLDRCLKSDTILANQLKTKEKYSIYICQNGMVDVATPITIDGVHVANLFIGQFFFETPDKDFFIKQADELGFDKEKYIKALEECHVYNKETILRFLDFFSGLINMIGESALKTIKQKKQVTEIANKDERAAELIIVKEQAETANAVIKEAAKYNRSLIETSLDPLVTIGLDGIITDVNSATEKATGLPREKIIGSDFSEYFTEPGKARAGYKHAFDVGKVVDFELYLKHINGSSIPVLYNASVYKDIEGQIIGVFAAARDISAIKKYEDELINFRNNLESIVQQKTAELLIANKELAFRNDEKDKRAAELVLANRELIFQTGEKADRAAELVIADEELVFQTGEKADRAAELLIANKELIFQNEEKEKRAEELLIANKELVFQNAEKDKRAAELIIANKELIFQNEEKVRRAVRTEKLKEQNIELEMQKKQLDEASQLKSSFLSNMSHELRTPLNAIVGFSELALKTSLSPRQRNYLSKIKISSHTLLGLISDILDLSKIEAGKLELEMATFNLEEVLQNAVNQVSVKSQEKGLKLMVSIDEEVPLILNGDSLRLGQILLNLVSNAVKFTDKGEIAIRVELLEENGDSASIQFSIKDTGIGMTDEQVIKLFQPFTQADTSTTRKYGGTGLGLAISQNLVGLMSGDIWVKSEEGVGSTFFFTVKVNIADKERFKHYKNTFENWGKKVLLVDDIEESREIIGSMLAEMSLDVVMSSSGEEAIAILEKTKEENCFDLVIMDWKMPGIDGIEASRQIKNMFSIGKAPAIILVTAYTSEGVQEKAKQIGVLEDVLYKPVTSSLLYNAIIHACNKEGIEIISASSEKENDYVYLPQLRDVRILLVEDNEINQEMAREILQEAGLKVTIANNGREAVDKVKTNAYDIVLMDIQMPIMDGYDATREIRKDPVFAELPIIAMTANASLSDQKKCFQAGMNDHVAKPIDMTKLFQTIAHWMKMEQGTIQGKTPFGKPPTPYSSTNEALSEYNDIIPDLAGIDVQAGLNRLGDNKKLYCELLVKFHKNHKQAIKEIRYALDQDDLKTAERLVHTIKGAAGNLGAQDVYIDSGALEAELKTNRPANVELLLKKLEQALEQTFASIALVEKNNQNIQSLCPDGADTTLLIPILNKLEKLLHDNDMDSAECVEEIVRQTKNTVFSEKTTKMKNYVEQFDFEGALSILDEILNSVVKV